MIPVNKPFLPPVEVYNRFLKGIWDRNWLTNNGPLVNQLERRLKEFIGAKYLLFTTNGTIALQMAIKALDLTGEIITTPFSYVATTSSIAWEGCTPVFADIDPLRLTIDPNKIENLISEKTSAIIATHVYGIPAHIEELEKIALKHGIKVIYDGAHAFGTVYKGRPLLNFGDISILSTHATKLFHTVEGGLLIAKTEKMGNKLALLRNFGHAGPGRFNGIGINGKNSEFHAAMGLANLQFINEILEKRKAQFRFYVENLSSFNGRFLKIPKHTIYNYSYLPVIFKSEDSLLKINKLLENNKIFARRYFYPALNHLDYVNDQNLTPVAEDISKRILCLPLYHDLSFEEILMICKIILNA